MKRNLAIGWKQNFWKCSNYTWKLTLPWSSNSLLHSWFILLPTRNYFSTWRFICIELIIEKLQIIVLLLKYVIICAAENIQKHNSFWGRRAFYLNRTDISITLFVHTLWVWRKKKKNFARKNMRVCKVYFDGH